MNYDNWLFDYILFVMCCLMVVLGAFMSPDEHIAIDIMILILMLIVCISAMIAKYT